MPSPVPGRSLQGLIAPWIDSLVQVRAEATSVSQNDEAVDHDLSVWLVHRVVVGEQATLSQALSWFTADRQASCSESVSLAPLEALPIGADLAPVLPYVLEAFEPHMRNGADRDLARSSRRGSSSYYTPGDLALFVIERTFERMTGDNLVTAQVIDPACGTGVFLRATGKYLAARTGRPFTEVADQLFGVDLSKSAIRSAAFVLLAEALLSGPAVSPKTLFERIRRNFVEGDATVLAAEAAWTPSPVPTHFPRKFDVLVGNPPFGGLPADSDAQTLRARTYACMGGRGARVPGYLPFVEMSWLWLREGASVAGLVLPLAIASNRDSRHRRTRAAMRTFPARWDVYAFDRSPDSLFGDDVKTRNAVLIMTPGTSGISSEICTTGLRRWSIRSRADVFTGAKPVSIGEWPIARFIPKLDSVFELDAYRLIRSMPIRSPHNSGDHRLEVGSTAYNWLSLSRLDHKVEETQRRSGTTFRYACAESADAAYAALSSRLTYWLWRVEGDGFHVTADFLKSIPYQPWAFDEGIQGILARLGKDLWERAQTNPVRAVNASRETVSYVASDADELLSEIDAALSRHLGLTAEFAHFLKNHQATNVLAGRSVYIARST